MWPIAKQISAAYGPGFILGLFLARLIGELLAQTWAITPTVFGLLVLAGLIAACFGWWQRRSPWFQRWPLLLLLLYVVYPQPSWPAATAVAATTLIIYLLFCHAHAPDIPRRMATAVFATLITLLFLALYLATLAPDVLPADSGELQLVAATLGVAHPPGFALYTLLAHALTRLPIGETAAYRVNLLSAITSTLTLLAVWTAVTSLKRHPIAGLTAVLALGTATTFWAQATTANVRSLTALFAALAIVLLLRFRAATQRGETAVADRALAHFALVMALGLTHHLSLVFMGLVFGLFVFIVDPRLLRTPRRWWRPLLWAMVGLLPLLYFPLRAASGAPGATPDLATWSGWLNHVLGLGFRGDFFYFTDPLLLWERLKVMGNVLTFQFHPLLLVGASLGLLRLWWQDRALAGLLGGAFSLHLLITATYRAPQTVEYMLPAYVPLALCLGYGVGWLAEAGRAKMTKLFYVGAAVLLVTAVYQSLAHYPSYAALRTLSYARGYAQPLLGDAPPNSTILADWHWATPLWYLQEVESYRPDVTVEFVYPRSADYGADWAGRITAELGNGRAVIATHFDESAYATLPPPEPIGDAFLFRQEARLALPATFSPLTLVLGDAIQIVGYNLNQPAIPIGQEAILTLAWQPLTALPTPLTLFAHLVGPDGRLYAQQDLPATPQSAGLTLTQFRLTPRPGALPGDFAVLVGAYSADPLPAADGATRTTVATLPVQAMARPPFTGHRLNLVLVERPWRRLVGYDWDNTLPGQTRLYLHWQTAAGFISEVIDNAADYILPTHHGPGGLVIHGGKLPFDAGQHYVPLGQGIIWTGAPLPAQTLTPEESLIVRQAFAAGAPVLSDLVVSVRLIGYAADGFHWAWWDLSDSIPAMGAMPTLKWIAGSQVRAPHFVTVSPEATNGQTAGGIVRLYDAFTNRPLPILDERIMTPWIPLGQPLSVVSPAQE
jgi:hypothetical protein